MIEIDLKTALRVLREAGFAGAVEGIEGEVRLRDELLATARWEMVADLQCHTIEERHDNPNLSKKGDLIDQIDLVLGDR